MHSQANEILSRLIAIDTEYHTNAIGKIDKVHCLCASDFSEKPFQCWTVDYKGEDILSDLKGFYGVEKPIFVCHSLELAERRALKFLGVDTSKYDFICTYHLAKMLKNSFCKASARVKLKNKVFDTERQKINVAMTLKRFNEDALSYAGLCAKYGLALIDTEHKEAMRKLCIDDTTDGNEQQIMDYCSDDTKYLIPLFRKLFNEYYIALKDSFCPMRPGRFDNLQPLDAIKYLTQQSMYINEFGDIADEGLPISLERVEKVKSNAPAYREKLKSDFNEKYPGTFKPGKDGFLHEDVAMLQKYLADEIDKYRISDYPRSDSGRLSMSDETLKEYFAVHELSFGEDYRQLNKLSRKLNGVSKQSDNPFDYIIDGNLWYESLQPYGTITSRCTPSTKRFIFGWHKSLYGILEPKPGKWLVELDFGSEETFIQCCICNDDNYHAIYQSKDIYLAFANKMNLVPDDDWNNLTKDELKQKYDDVRKRIKSLVLGLSYGMGAKKLAKRLGLSQIVAENYVTSVNNILYESAAYKNRLQREIMQCKAFSLPDGFICKAADNCSDNNTTTIINWPFQSAGGMILRAVVHHLTMAIKNHEIKAKLLATIHDAIFFEVDEGDNEAIQKISDTMKNIANACLRAPGQLGIKVGEPEKVERGKIWTPDMKFNTQFEELLNFS